MNGPGDRRVEGYYPVFLKVAGLKAVVIGGGNVAARKAATLAGSGATVTVISPRLSTGLRELVDAGTVRHEPRKYAEGDVKGASIAIAATDDPDVNAAVCREAGMLGIPVNSVRPPEAGSFIVPSTIKRGGLTVAVSTGGGCPALSRRLRKDLEAFIGDGYGPFLEFLEEARAELKARVPDENSRARALTELVESGLMEAFRRAGPDAVMTEIVTEARAMLARHIERYKG